MVHLRWSFLTYDAELPAVRIEPTHLARREFLNARA
jgi:hypothetical protein